MTIIGMLVHEERKQSYAPQTVPASLVGRMSGHWRRHAHPLLPRLGDIASAAGVVPLDGATQAQDGGVAALVQQLHAQKT